MSVWNLSDKLDALVSQNESTNEQINKILLEYENELISAGSHELLESLESAEQSLRMIDSIVKFDN